MKYFKNAILADFCGMPLLPTVSPLVAASACLQNLMSNYCLWLCGNEMHARKILQSVVASGKLAKLEFSEFAERYWSDREIAGQFSIQVS